MKAELAILADL